MSLHGSGQDSTAAPVYCSNVSHQLGCLCQVQSCCRAHHLGTKLLNQLDAVDELSQQLHSIMQMVQLLCAGLDVLHGRDQGGAKSGHAMRDNACCMLCDWVAYMPNLASPKVGQVATDSNKEEGFNDPGAC